MVLLGMKGNEGVMAVLGVAGVVCVSCAVAGEMLQDLKVGHILGGTPRKMQLGDIIGVMLASVVLFIPLVILNEGSKGGFGVDFPAPQASLMAMLSQGIVGGQMSWLFIVVGILMGLGMILMQVRSPMLVSVGMYLPLETTFAIFIGGVIKWAVEQVSEMKKHNQAQKVRTENNGILLASGFIAGEALMGLLFATIVFITGKKAVDEIFYFFANPSFAGSLILFFVLALVLIFVPIKNAGKPDEPAPPSAII
jgi:putative OPT family oligopeptide transporter